MPVSVHDAFAVPNSRTDFDVALRGYDRVEAVVEQAEEASSSSAPSLRAAVHEELRAACPVVVLRGYRSQVDSFFKAMAKELDQVH